MKHRVRHVLAVIMTGCALAGCATAAGGTGTVKPARGHAVAPSTGGPRAARCGPGTLALTYGPRLSPMTGEHGVLYELVNRGHVACVLAGYPHVSLYSGAEVLPFRYASGGGPYVTGRAPATVTVKPGGAAWILVAKYRCDLGDLRGAATLSLAVPGMAGAPLTGPVPRYGSGASALPYCRGGAGDPGQTVAVSPIEPAPAAVSRS